MAWPVHVPPLPGEVASSWLVRAARAYGETPRGFTMLAWGRRSVWTRDLDSTLDPDALCSLGEHLGAGDAEAAGTSLRPHIHRLGGTSSLSPGLLRVGVYHRVRRRHGQQYCPRCLNEDAVAYYRRDWRLAFVVICRRHGEAMRDGCPVCDGPLVAHRSPDLMLESCSQCGESLICAAEPADAALLNLQDTMWRYWDDGYVTIKGKKVAFPEWMSGIRILCHAVRRSRTRASVVETLEEVTGLALPKTRRPPMFELSRTAHRTPALAAALWLVDDWPHRFLDFAKSLDLTLSDILDITRTCPPTWLREALEQLPYHPVGRPRRPRRKKRPIRQSVKDARRQAGMAGAVHDRLDTLESERPS